jgi:tetratricopeptide (TPR) repeat protein
MPELETPSCPKCGAAITRDEFDYPPYVYDAMGRARLDYGMLKLKDNEHENAIECFEMAKRLFEKAGNAKMVEESTRRADEGYDAIAESHIVQGERHLKSGEFEWAVVQFKKAREFYMFSTDAKKRARCAERIRECYSGWGRELEAEGDSLAKSGQSRDALAKYKEAAEKFREGEDPKKLAGLERKIRKA